MLPKVVVVFTTTAVRTAVMPVSARNCAKRSFVTVLLSVASTYSVKVKVNRDSKDKDLLGAYRQVVKKAHPDKGGDKAKFQRLQAAKEAWAAECQKFPKVGAPFASADDLVLSKPGFAPGPQGVRVRGQSVLLTYFGTWSLTLWRAFLAFVRTVLLPWSVLRLCAGW